MKRVLAFLLCGVVLFASGCSNEKNADEAPSASEPRGNLEGRQEAYDHIESHVRTNVSPDVLETIMSVSSYSTDGETVRVTIRVYAADGLYIPQAATEICPLVLESAKEKEYTVGTIVLQEYFEDMKNKNEKTDFIQWETKDGASGTLVDDRPGKEIMEFDYSIDSLFEYFDVSKT